MTFGAVLLLTITLVPGHRVEDQEKQVFVDQLVETSMNRSLASDFGNWLNRTGEIRVIRRGTQVTFISSRFSCLIRDKRVVSFSLRSNALRDYLTSQSVELGNRQFSVSNWVQSRALRYRPDFGEEVTVHLSQGQRGEKFEVTWVGKWKDKYLINCPTPTLSFDPATGLCTDFILPDVKAVVETFEYGWMEAGLTEAAADNILWSLLGDFAVLSDSEVQRSTQVALVPTVNVLDRRNADLIRFDEENRRILVRKWTVMPRRSGMFDIMVAMRGGEPIGIVGDEEIGVDHSESALQRREKLFGSALETEWRTFRNDLVWFKLEPSSEEGDRLDKKAWIMSRLGRLLLVEMDASESRFRIDGQVFKKVM